MKYTGTLIAVKDMEKSKQFYHDVLGMEVAADFGANVTLTGGLVLLRRGYPRRKQRTEWVSRLILWYQA